MCNTAHSGSATRAACGTSALLSSDTSWGSACSRATPIASALLGSTGNQREFNLEPLLGFQAGVGVVLPQPRVGPLPDRRQLVDQVDRRRKPVSRIVSTKARHA